MILDQPECPECGGYNVIRDGEDDNPFMECWECGFAWDDDDDDAQWNANRAAEMFGPDDVDDDGNEYVELM